MTKENLRAGIQFILDKEIVPTEFVHHFGKSYVFDLKETLGIQIVFDKNTCCVYTYMGFDMFMCFHKPIGDNERLENSVWYKLQYRADRKLLKRLVQYIEKLKLKGILSYSNHIVLDSKGTFLGKELLDYIEEENIEAIERYIIQRPHHLFYFTRGAIKDLKDIKDKLKYKKKLLESF
ncbi:hypothetical protein [Paenibacillus polymyxa]|uniref:Uncharacterized protein n=1 Tax=Paenibacillus polymyxa (strain SC2) TaxID=886882 RepID=E3EJQ2_PAEPS|nr:hypothetical protein [Paenibacillus polymyxa]ADO59650.1 hypothetical protein PPSC2_26895 [Paenibacillus polymyxa SC2]WPQ59526.1 hypothetical protein SKN87_28090 [Paenibacillus polymyxa]